MDAATPIGAALALLMLCWVLLCNFDGLSCFATQAQSMVQQHVGQLLPAVAAAAHSAQKGLRTGHTRASTPMPQNAAQAAEFERTLAQTRWLCSLAGQQALQRNAAAVLGVRRVPKEVAAIVQQAGLQLTTEDLVAAARSRAEGLENWLVEPYCTELHPVVFAVLAGRAVSDCLHAVLWHVHAAWPVSCKFLQDPARSCKILQPLQACTICVIVGSAETVLS